MIIHRLIPVLLLLGCASLQAQITTPGLFKALKGQKAKGQQMKVVQHAKQIGFALFQFDADYGRWPGEKSAEELNKETNGEAQVAADSSNDCFFQLISGGYVDNPELFAPDRKDQAGAKKDKPNKLEHCFFSYISGGSSANPAAQPLVMAPLIKGKKTFDPKPLNGKAVVLLIDMSVHVMDINEEGRVMIDGKDLFDPKQPYWNGKEPTVKWPE